MKALVNSYYWRSTNPEPYYDEESLGALMDQSFDPDLDGERAQAHSSALISALASSGDELFSTVLLTRDTEIQQSVRSYIFSAWTWNNLKYPKTESIYNESKSREVN